MMTRPIKVKHKTYRSRNPLPASIWVLFIIIFSTGYFVGGTMQAIAYKNDMDKTNTYLNKRLNQR